MPENNSDDLADALARMASGDVAPSEHEPAAPPPPAPNRTVRPANSRPTAPRAAAPPTSPPATPAPTPSAPPIPPVVPPRIRPVAPALQTGPAASQPVIRAATPVTRKPRPSAPEIAPRQVPAAPVDPVEPPIETEPQASEIIDDDDMMAIPAPEASVFQAKSRSTVADARAKIAAKRSLEFRRTLIPILLTCGVMMLGFASLKSIADPDSSLVAVPVWVPVLLVCGAVILLGLAVLNMVSVKQQLSSVKTK